MSMQQDLREVFVSVDKDLICELGEPHLLNGVDPFDDFLNAIYEGYNCSNDIISDLRSVSLFSFQ